MYHSISYWESETYFSPQDFIIVGGGLVGLWTAYELKQSMPKAKVAILERGVVPSGASTRNAGFACFGSPTEMLSDMNVMGESEMWSLVEMRFKGIKKVRSVLGDKAISFDPVGGYECLSEDKHNIKEIESKLNDLNIGFQTITGIDKIFACSNEKLHMYGLSGFDALIENKYEGGLHSGKLVYHLSKVVQESGVLILNGVEVKSWHKANSKVIVETEICQLVTENLIIATNGFINNFLPELNVRPARGQVLVTQPIQGLKLKGTFHYDEGYFYFRNIGNRILLGGGRNLNFKSEETMEMSTTHQIQDFLEHFLQKHIAGNLAYEISNRWGGVMAFTANKKPMIKEISPNVFCIICCNGMGVAVSPVIAEKVACLFG